jgi:hypothetical protein
VVIVDYKKVICPSCVRNTFDENLRTEKKRLTSMTYLCESVRNALNSRMMIATARIKG